MFKREIASELKALAKDYPVVTVLGPRQSGKTTLVRYVFPKKPYANLEDLEVREMAKSDPRAFLEQFPRGAVLDEIQRVPSLLSYIQVMSDERDEKGLFILTGSHQIELHEAITQSLAGRTALLELLPMSLSELANAGFHLTLDEVMIQGGYPRIYKDALDPSKAYRNYFQTYVERDLRQLLHVKDLSKFQRFVHLCAGRIGQLVNAASLAGDVGVSSHTINEWLSILEASFILVLLQPYYENFGKRVIKAPKLYFTDVGLAAYLLGIKNTDQMNRDPLRGHLIENLVLLELIKFQKNRGLDSQLYFFRDAHGNEVDLVFQSARELIPIEIKAAKTFNTEFLKSLNYFKTLVGNRCQKGFLIYGGLQEQKLGIFRLLHYSHAVKAITSAE